MHQQLVVECEGILVQIDSDSAQIDLGFEQCSNAFPHSIYIVKA